MICRREPAKQPTCRGNVDTSQVHTEDASLVESVRKHTGVAFGAKPGEAFNFHVMLCDWIFMHVHV